MGTLHLRCVLRAARFREHRHPSICRLHHLTHTPSHNRNAGHEITAELPPMKSYALKARVHAGDGALALELDLARELQVRFWLGPPPPVVYLFHRCLTHPMPAMTAPRPVPDHLGLRARGQRRHLAPPRHGALPASALPPQQQRGVALVRAVVRHSTLHMHVMLDGQGALLS